MESLLGSAAGSELPCEAWVLPPTLPGVPFSPLYPSNAEGFAAVPASAGPERGGWPGHLGTCQDLSDPNILRL